VAVAFPGGVPEAEGREGGMSILLRGFFLLFFAEKIKEKRIFSFVSSRGGGLCPNHRKRVEL
jgi:hypothetical protein